MLLESLDGPSIDASNSATRAGRSISGRSEDGYDSQMESPHGGPGVSPARTASRLERTVSPIRNGPLAPAREKPLLRKSTMFSSSTLSARQESPYLGSGENGSPTTPTQDNKAILLVEDNEINMKVGVHFGIRKIQVS